jgi:hypothetical protein
MARITYGKDKKELGVTNSKALEYTLKQRLNRANQNSITDTSNEVNKNTVQVVINAPAVKNFFVKKKNK